ncbi:hypothetical protein BCR33DRAFT_805109 [Rhizoclosmatium globosum]|uniref:Uncharacterized protein n=1 Tax=Rhizoclosmatium globosum TaxID=329046 RepID=A0A1Y2CM04_9FUNG|nr:hypothetical protein BCR33DRAFT_805109 [Rhizoclosmatium globosum]|eukprot:ORY48042.1 hypothetical protein BCR33DRAFT_805109 [Rhizoclosmatium globosum]
MLPLLPTFVLSLCTLAASMVALHLAPSSVSLLQTLSLAGSVVYTLEVILSRCWYSTTPSQAWIRMNTFATMIMRLSLAFGMFVVVSDGMKHTSKGHLSTMSLTEEVKVASLYFLNTLLVDTVWVLVEEKCELFVSTYSHGGVSDIQWFDCCDKVSSSDDYCDASRCAVFGNAYSV